MHIQQNSVKRYNKIQEIICDVLDKSKTAIVGSRADGLCISPSSDVDLLIFAHTFKVFDCIKEPFNMDVMNAQLIRVPDEGHPDKVNKYTYKDSKDGILYLKNNVKELVDPVYVSITKFDEYTTNGPAHTFGFDPQKTHSVFKPDHSHTFETISNRYVDIVLGISSKQWPVEAHEWITRQRASNWLTKGLIDHIINTGYILAGVGSKESNEREIQWRVSFNEAEQLLIESFNETQEANETGENRTDSEKRKKYFDYMKLSASADLTHTTLRMATCYFDDDIKEDCLNIILKVTQSDGHHYMQTHSQCLNQTLNCDIEAFICDIDLVHQDPYRTTNEFEKLKEKGHVLYGYDTLVLAWKECYFDVTFMLAELPVLPKPAALELCIDFSQKHICFHPFLYGLLLEFLWHHKYGSGNEEKKSVLKKMENCISDLPDDQQSRGLNFIVYCYLLQKDYLAASRYLFRSFKLNPVEQNVAYLYIKYIVALMRKAVSDDNEDSSLWLHVLGIELNID
ncbi:unnamed protein product [Mytilus edulis]|uniref:Mab-21-like nucleotidyltransferase domain-containing protein n=1 Tax=Mytilus edulis TaxID=6550 RepID=A0A8S3UF52_MYTED|nr:unnamed protein product [Mytilus edulis]